MSTTKNLQGNSNLDYKIKDTQAKVDEVIDIVKENIFIKLNERTEKLTNLEQRANALEHGALQFQKQTVKLKRQYWWKNIKIISIIGLIIIGFILLVIIILVTLQIFENSTNFDDNLDKTNQTRP